jgi:lipopolysaccharide transport system permease protein
MARSSTVTAASGADVATAAERAIDAKPEWVIEPRGAGLVARSRELVRSGHLFRHFAMETLRRRYKKTVLGWVWILIKALLPVLINTLVFNGLARIDSGPVPYFLFLTVGFAIWALFAESLMWTTRSLQMFGKLLAKLYFPRLILPPATMALACVNFAIYIGIFVATAFYYLASDGVWYLSLDVRIIYSVAAVLMCMGLALGLGLFTSVLGAETRDLRFTLPFILQFWFILTPVAYPLSLVSERWWWTTYANPMTPVVQLFRAGLFGQELGLAPVQVLVAAGAIALVLASGLWFFSRAEATAVDRL